VSQQSATPSIYLDYHATTPVLPEVLEAMSPYFCNHFGNANSTHQWGWKAERAYNQASLSVSQLLGAKPSQVYFTSGATESIHWCLVGWARNHPGGRILTTSTEHKATYGALDFAAELGANTKILDVDDHGRLDIESLKKELDQDSSPTLLSFIWGNNEVGTLNPMEEILHLKSQYSHLMVHADGAQCVGKLPMDFDSFGLDFFSFSGHKLYAPKGIGGLLIKDSIGIKPLFSGGGQQRGQRAGTIDVPSVVGLGAACQWAQTHMQQESLRLQNMRDFLISELVDGDQVRLNGHPSERLPNNISLTFRDLSLDQLLLKLPRVAFSSSSACSSGTASTSHVLRALGLTPAEAQKTLRFGLGRENQPEDVEFVVGQIKKILLNS
jgi:cysteine desulfurase